MKIHSPFRKIGASTGGSAGKSLLRTISSILFRASTCRSLPDFNRASPQIRQSSDLQSIARRIR